MPVCSGTPERREPGAVVVRRPVPVPFMQGDDTVFAFPFPPFQTGFMDDGHADAGILLAEAQHTQPFHR